MAFGFPALYTENYSVQIEIESREVFKLFKKAISECGWESNYQFEGDVVTKIFAKVPGTGTSWGQKVEISMLKNGLFEIKSKSIWQVIDYGANENAVKEIIECFGFLIREYSRDLQRKVDLIKKYGQENGEKVYNKELFLDMTEEMLLEALGNPSNKKETVTRSKIIKKYYFNPRETRQSTTVYGLEVTLEDDVVSGWKELE